MSAQPQLRTPPTQAHIDGAMRLYEAIIKLPPHQRTDENIEWLLMNLWGDAP